MKPLTCQGMSLGVLLLLVLACSVQVPTPVPPPTEPIASVVPQGDALPKEPTRTPTLVPINLGGPPIGTPMVWVDGSILVPVPGGDFIMGDGGDDNPIHTVALSTFWIYRTEVTNRMYSLCIATGMCTPPLSDEAVKALSEPGWRDQPVVDVDWSQADAYCKFAFGHLPTEAQWEKTARGPEGNIYPWGDSAPDCDLLNFDNCVGDTSKVFDHPAGKSYYEGLDLSGNVFEWVTDWYSPQYYSQSPAADPVGPEIGQVRSVRSSSYSSAGNLVSPARRFFLEPDLHREDLGFRCVVDKPTEFAPFCQQVYVPGYPGGDTPPPASDCPTPKLTTYQGHCIDQALQQGNGSVKIEGGTVSSVSGSSCFEQDPGLWFCTGEQGTSVTVTVCLECAATPQPGIPGNYCPPGTFYDTTQLHCSDDNTLQRCPNGYTYDSSNLCCVADPGTSYPGCNSKDEFYNPLTGLCEPGTAPLGDSCSTATIPLGSCRQPDDGGDDQPQQPTCPEGQQLYCYYDNSGLWVCVCD